MSTQMPHERISPATLTHEVHISTRSDLSIQTESAVVHAPAKEIHARALERRQVGIERNPTSVIAIVTKAAVEEPVIEDRAGLVGVVYAITDSDRVVGRPVREAEPEAIETTLSHESRRSPAAYVEPASERAQLHCVTQDGGPL